VTAAAQPAPSAPVAEPQQAETKVANAGTAAASALAGAVKLRWPTTGRIIAGFGARPDGTHNDGINLAVPLGTDVHAAEAGVVAYAGNELKGYGNLVLLRHDNGWVTAYAHNDELLVKRGDKVKRGQVIAKAGKTGSVDRPQVHFELRQGSKPVDPIPYLEKL
jgi:murein DD-endopeptidase MepM/ murein hydrolase activator NlpD